MAEKPSAPVANSGPKCEYLFKVVVVGELATGKTALVKRYVHNFFTDHYRTTIGVDFALKIVKTDDGSIIRLQLWDIAGQERFGSMTRTYYKEAFGAIIVFDVSRASTFDAVSKWKADLDNKVELPNRLPVPCILLANKCDLPKVGLVNNAQQMDNYCRDKGFVKWFETSAKENTNIETAIRYLVNEIMKYASEMKPDDPDIIKPGDLSKPIPGPEPPGGCCGGKK